MLIRDLEGWPGQIERGMRSRLWRLRDAGCEINGRESDGSSDASTLRQNIFDIEIGYEKYFDIEVRTEVLAFIFG